MAEAAAREQLHTYWQPELIEQPPLVINVAEMMEDQLVRRRAERLITAVATIVAESCVEEIPVAEATSESHITSLMDAIHQAAAGNETARKVVEMNARTDAIERTIKARHILRVEMEAAEDGSVTQYGQPMESIQTNTLRFASSHPHMRRRAEAEARNAYRIENLNRQDLLDDYYFVVFSRPADGMSEQEMRAENFFTDTMSIAIQTTTKEDGKIVTETAFAAGSAQAEDVPYRQGAAVTVGARYDRTAIAAVGDILQVDLDKSDVETIDTPLLIRKDALPNGAADLYWLVESAAGIERPYQEYLTLRENSEQRQADFEPRVQAIVTELIGEASQISDPVTATQRLNKISGKHMVERAVEDPTIDSRVFGPVAAANIEAARWYTHLGNMEQAQLKTSEAIKTETSTSCPGGTKNSNSAGLDGDSDGGSGGESSKDEDQYGSLEFDCPKCHKTNRRSRGELIPKCQHCKADVSCK